MLTDDAEAHPVSEHCPQLPRHLPAPPSRLRCPGPTIAALFIILFLLLLDVRSCFAGDDGTFASTSLDLARLGTDGAPLTMS